VEDFRLTSAGGGIASVCLAWLPNLASLSTGMDVLLKLTSLVSVLLIITLNIKKLRNGTA
jgi:hypothetical protein